MPELCCVEVLEDEVTEFFKGSEAEDYHWHDECCREGGNKVY